jgi:hypothetical protein
MHGERLDRIVATVAVFTTPATRDSLPGARPSRLHGYAQGQHKIESSLTDCPMSARILSLDQ